MSVKQQLAKKYAQAWLALYDQDMNLEVLDGFRKAIHFLKDYTSASFYLRLSVISDDDKKQALVAFIDAYGLPTSLHKLVTLLLEHKRSFLFPAIVVQIDQAYAQNNHIQTFMFSSAVELNENSCKALQRFLAAKTGCAIIYEKRVDKALIAGIRLQSTTYLWEYSLAQQLHVLQNALMQ